MRICVHVRRDYFAAASDPPNSPALLATCVPDALLANLEGLCSAAAICRNHPAPTVWAHTHTRIRRRKHTHNQPMQRPSGRQPVRMHGSGCHKAAQHLKAPLSVLHANQTSNIEAQACQAHRLVLFLRTSAPRETRTPKASPTCQLPSKQFRTL